MGRPTPRRCRSARAERRRSPAYPIALLILAGATPTSAEALRWVVVMTIAFVIDWTAYLVAVAQIAQVMRKDDRLLAFVSAHNWSQLAAYLIFLAMMSVDLAMGGSPNGLFLFGVQLYLLAFQGFVAMALLGFTAVGAFGLVLMALIINQMTFIVALGVLGA
ncbi:MAG: hypothetical protein AAF684_05165 [Pseudomonadota bacterium]